MVRSGTEKTHEKRRSKYILEGSEIVGSMANDACYAFKHALGAAQN